MPIHVHVENADGRAKFSLEPTVELIKNEDANGFKESQISCVKLSKKISSRNGMNTWTKMMLSNVWAVED